MNWRAWGDSNARPTAPEAVTLSTELQARLINMRNYNIFLEKKKMGM